MVAAVSVIIPSHNRHDMLREAIASVCSQTYPHWEIVIVDDGSQPALDEEALRREFSPNIKVIRNETPVRLNTARDQGVQAAQHDIVVQLDNDDLLAPNALALSVQALLEQSDDDIVFLGVTGFASRGSNFDETQNDALLKLFLRLDMDSIPTTRTSLPPSLFPALLKSVPMAFQRSIEHKTAWNKVSQLRREAYKLDTGINNDDDAMQRITPPLRDSEWALYAAASCRCGYLPGSIYLQRCDGQGDVSRPEKAEHAMLSNIDIKHHLHQAASKIPELALWQKEIRQNYAQVLFTHAYYLFHRSKRKAAFDQLLLSLKVAPCLKHLKFGFRMLLPHQLGRSTS